MVFAGSKVVEVADWSVDQTCTQKNPLVKGLADNSRTGAVGGLFQRKYPVICGGYWVEKTYKVNWHFIHIDPSYETFHYDCTNLVTGESVLKKPLIEPRMFSASVMLDDDRMMIIGGKKSR